MLISKLNNSILVAGALINEENLELVESDDVFVIKSQEEIAIEKAELELENDERRRQEIIDNIKYLESEIAKRI